MLGTICQGGCFVCKIFDAFSHVTVGLLFVVASLFEEAWIVKPHHSRVVNSERYLVGKGFRGTQRPCFDRVQRAVETAHSLWPVPGTAGAWSGLAPLHVIAPEEMRADAGFLASVQAMTVTLCRRQASALEEVMDRALQLQSSGESKMKRQRVRKKQEVSSICCW
ncbi:unnamed protein product [Prorocentrum cordatum]|uniref:Cap-specific mRNA (nucleoside-2'-O-)-methyltransferase 1 n=1 Tax=Prorocentrum cordatum TaxID=2364126 RepID=A0ABN9W7Q1_9DINO|nr:unnamed protein product [Polarella glacialis]